MKSIMILNLKQVNKSSKCYIKRLSWKKIFKIPMYYIFDFYFFVKIFLNNSSKKVRTLKQQHDNILVIYYVHINLNTAILSEYCKNIKITYSNPHDQLSNTEQTQLKFSNLSIPFPIPQILLSTQSQQFHSYLSPNLIHPQPPPSF